MRSLLRSTFVCAVSICALLGVSTAWAKRAEGQSQAIFMITPIGVEAQQLYTGASEENPKGVEECLGFQASESNPKPGVDRIVRILFGDYRVPSVGEDIGGARRKLVSEPKVPRFLPMHTKSASLVFGLLASPSAAMSKHLSTTEVS